MGGGDKSARCVLPQLSCDEEEQPHEDGAALINQRVEQQQLSIIISRKSCAKFVSGKEDSPITRASASLPSCQHDEGLPAVPYRAGQEAQDPTEGVP
ncbi:unnamed protein product [Pleuronectes platessa]|uniref:Uncharacterized protein n=1 Tax=Pleuronectes platessa TaxID=8262 RepID=A0A9N7Z3V3_PLEPL|nr:unnamed protein product [Pleuronectes platessa]